MHGSDCGGGDGGGGGREGAAGLPGPGEGEAAPWCPLRAVSTLCHWLPALSSALPPFGFFPVQWLTCTLPGLYAWNLRMISARKDCWGQERTLGRNMKGHFVLREPRVVPCGWWAFGESCSRNIKSLTDTDKGLELTLAAVESFWQILI